MIGSDAEFDMEEGNNQNPRQVVGPYRNEQANGGINLYLSSYTFISGRRQTG